MNGNDGPSRSLPGKICSTAHSDKCCREQCCALCEASIRIGESANIAHTREQRNTRTGTTAFATGCVQCVRECLRALLRQYFQARLTRNVCAAFFARIFRTPHARGFHSISSAMFDAKKSFDAAQSAAQITLRDCANRHVFRCKIACSNHARARSILARKIAPTRACERQVKSGQTP